MQPVSASSKVVRDSLGDFVGIFRVLELFILFLAMLIAYNAASINTDERSREHATLFAFGLPLRRVLRMDFVESLLIGLLGTAIGLLAGLGTRTCICPCLAVAGLLTGLSLGAVGHDGTTVALVTERMPSCCP